MSALLDELRAKYKGLVDGLLDLNAVIDEKLNLLEEKEQQWNELIGQVHENAQASEAKVDLNVGGRLFTTSRANLLRWEGTYFHAMLHDTGQWEPDGKDGAYFIDRDPDMFGHVMRLLRTGNLASIQEISTSERQLLLDELDYYQVPAVSPLVGEWHTPRWDRSQCHGDLELSENNLAVSMNTDSGWCSALGTGPSVASFKIHLRAGSRIMIGFARPSLFRIDGSNYDKSGWFIDCSTGSLCSGFGDAFREYTRSAVTGDVIEAQLDLEAKQISFELNGNSLGVAFTEVETNDEVLLPCVDLGDKGARVAFADYAFVSV